MRAVAAVIGCRPLLLLPLPLPLQRRPPRSTQQPSLTHIIGIAPSLQMQRSHY